MLYLSVATSASPAHGDASSSVTRPKPKSKRMRLLLLIAIVVIALVCAVWYFLTRYTESTNDAYLQADSVTLAPKVSGNIVAVLVNDNQLVKAGDPLVRIENDQYQARVNEMQATIKAREAAIERARADITRQQAEIEQAQAQYASAQVQLRYASHEYDRYRPLAASGAEASEHLADLKRSRDAAQADVAANAAAVKAASAQIATLKAQIVQSEAELASSRASLAQSDIDLKNTLVSSPIDGVIGNRTVRVGQYVQPGTRMLTVVPLNDIYLTANFKETQLTNMRPGQPATLHVDALPDLKIKGVVDSFSPGTGSQFALLPPENATGNFTKIVQRVPVKIRINASPEERKRLLPGMSVTVDVDTHEQGAGK